MGCAMNGLATLTVACACIVSSVPIPAVSFVSMTSAASAETSSAKAPRVIPPFSIRVLDGDTVEINNERMRLFGIDAPEGKQQCVWADGGSFDCGKAATRELRALLSFEVPPVIERRGSDMYGRSIVVLRDQTGLNINCELVARGVAWAYVDYSDMCLDDEKNARALGRGVFHGENTPPWEYRRKQKSNRNGTN